MFSKMAKFVQFHSWIFVISFAILDITYFPFSKNLVEAKNPLCVTRECQQMANIFMKSMNKQISPCNNFYDYACGRWKQGAQVPQFLDFWNMEEALQQKAYTVLRKLLEEPKKSPVQDVEDAKTLYRACMNLPRMTKVTPNVIKAIINKIDNWPMFSKNNSKHLSWADLDKAYIKLSGDSALFGIALTAAENRNHIVTTVIKQLFSPYGMLRRTKFWSSANKQRDHYKNFLREIIQRVSPEKVSNSMAAIERDLNAVMQFRDDLKKIITYLPHVEPKTLTISTVQIRYDQRLNADGNAKMNWLELIRHIYKDGKDAYGKPIELATMIQIHTHYVEALTKLLKGTPKNVILNHIHLHFAERHIIVTPTMLAELNQAFNVENGMLNGYKRVFSERHQECIESINLAKVVRLMYAKATISKPVIDKVKKLIGRSQQLFKESLTDCPWLDKATKAIAIKKIMDTTSSIGYPAWFDDPKLPKDPFDVDPLDPDAYYMPENNRIYFSASYLQPPAFGLDVPFNIDYAVIIPIITHELQHSFDPADMETFANETHWSQASLQELMKREKCFRDQYTQLRMNYITKFKMNQKASYPRTIDEDIADVTGLQLAYRGYKQRLQFNKGVCHVLPGFENMSCDKLFFIAYASNFCSATTQMGEENVIKLDSHSIPRIRVNGAVANMKEFSAAFGCTPKDSLNLKKRCYIWDH